ncbi:MAG: cation:proton antiporter [Hyphomonadaceae bacterium]
MIAPLVFAGAGVGVLVALALILLRGFLGPTLHDRMLAAHAFAMRAALLIAIAAVAFGARAWIDAAIALLFAEFVVVAAALKFLRYRTLQAPLAQPERAA